MLGRSLAERQGGSSQNESVRALMQIILEEIYSATKQRDRMEKSFVCYEDLKLIWSDKSRITTLLQLDLSQHQIDIIQKNMIRILSTLISVGATDCLTNFRTRLFDHSSGNPLVTDNLIPLEMNKLTFLDFEPAVKRQFYMHQFQFKPVEIVLSKGPIVIQDPMERLPFEYRKIGIGSGGYGEVDLVGISPRYIKREDGSSWDSVYEVACKKIRHHKDFNKEAHNLEILKESLIRHHRIMLHLTTIVHGSNSYILLPYARYGDLELFLHCGIGPWGKKNYDFDVYFPGARNSDVTKDLLRQCWSLASALAWLHDGIPIEKTSKVVSCVHMDFKPANILIQPDQGSMVGKWMISDFGVSVLKENVKLQGPEIGTVGDYAAQLTMNTEPTRPEGTYQAPEVEIALSQPTNIRSSPKGVGRKSDIWSYGCVFSEVLAFALGRDKKVNEFNSRRKGREERNYFYIVREDRGFLSAPDNIPKQYEVNPSVLTWLNSLCGGESWVDCCVETIKNILIVDTTRRPGADKLKTLVNHVQEHVSMAQVNCDVLRAKNEVVIQSTITPSTSPSVGSRDFSAITSGYQSPQLNRMDSEKREITSGNQSPQLNRMDSEKREVPPSNDDEDYRIRDSNGVLVNNNTVSDNSQGSSRPYSSISSVSARPEYAHGVMIYPDVRRISNESICKELPRPKGSKIKATSVALTNSGGEVYAACLLKSFIHFYKLDVEELPAEASFSPLELPLPNGWQNIAVGGFFLAAWGLFGSTKMLHLCDIRHPRPLQRPITLPPDSIEMLDRIVVSEQGAAALLCGRMIVVVDIRPPLHALDDQRFTDVAFNDSGELLFAWAYGKKDSLYVWRCRDCVVDERTESGCTYVTDKTQDPDKTRVIPYNMYPGCIIRTPNERFFAARVRSPRQSGNPQPRDHEVKIFSTRAVCMFRDHSMITIEKKLLKEYNIEYEDNHVLRSSGVLIGRLKGNPDKSSRLLVMKESENIIAIVCNLNLTVEFIKIVPASASISR